MINDAYYSLFGFKCFLCYFWIFIGMFILIIENNCGLFGVFMCFVICCMLLHVFSFHILVEQFTNSYVDSLLYALMLASLHLIYFVFCFFCFSFWMILVIIWIDFDGWHLFAFNIFFFVVIFCCHSKQVTEPNANSLLKNRS